MKIKASTSADWWTAPAESPDNGSLIMVTGRRDVGYFRNNPRYSIRNEVTWPYRGDSSGMPSVADSSLMEQVQESLNAVFDKDPIAVLTGIYTGDGQRNWIFYTLSTHIFQKKINEALEEYPLLPLEISSYNDPGWEEYDEMSELEVTSSED